MRVLIGWNEFYSFDVMHLVIQQKPWKVQLAAKRWRGLKLIIDDLFEPYESCPDINKVQEGEKEVVSDKKEMFVILWRFLRNSIAAIIIDKLHLFNR